MKLRKGASAENDTAKAPFQLFIELLLFFLNGMLNNGSTVSEEGDEVSGTYIEADSAVLTL